MIGLEYITHSRRDRMFYHVIHGQMTNESLQEFFNSETTLVSMQKLVACHAQGYTLIVCACQSFVSIHHALHTIAQLFVSWWTPMAKVNSFDHNLIQGYHRIQIRYDALLDSD